MTFVSVGHHWSIIMRRVLLSPRSGTLATIDYRTNRSPGQANRSADRRAQTDALHLVEVGYCRSHATTWSLECRGRVCVCVCESVCVSDSQKMAVGIRGV